MRRARFAVRVMLAGAALAAAAACDGESKSGDDGVPLPVSQSEFARDFSNAYCDSIGPCCSKGGYPFNLASCKQAVSVYIDAALSQYEGNPNVLFDEAVAGECVAGYRANFTACTSRDLRRAAGEACEGLLRGTVPQGGRCAETEECAPAAESSVNCDTGVCTVGEDPAPEARGKLGDACNMNCDEDQFSSYCFGMLASDPSPPGPIGCYASEGLFCPASSLRCAALPRLGEPCPDRLCAEDSYCSGAVCVAGVATGPCPTGNECVHTSRCDFDTQQCVPLLANGQPCESYDECLSGECERDTCRDWSVADEETCAGLFD